MVPGIDPKVDYAFKYLFGRPQNQAVLAHLLDAVLQPPPGAGIAQLEILNPFNPKEALDDKLSILDIKARDQRGRLFNVEVQLLPEFAFRNRVLYYWARLYGQQLQEGEDYTELRPTISICFVDFVLFPQTPVYHLAFQLRARGQPFVFTDDLALHILELPKFTRPPEQLTEPLDVWLYFLRHGENLDPDGLPGPLQVPEIQRALEDLTVLTKDEQERERYEARLKWQRDERSRLRYAREEGRAEGRTEGRAEGVAAARVQTYQRLLKRPPTALEELLALPLEELQRLAEQLEHEVFRE